MAALICDVCGGKLIMDESREFSRCEGCGCEYTVETMRNMLQALGGADVSVKGIASVENLIKRARILCSDGDFSNAKKTLEQALNADPENGEAYLVALMIDYRCKQEETLGQLAVDDLSVNANYQKAVRFGDEALQAKLESYRTQAKEWTDRKAAISQQVEAFLNEESRKAASVVQQQIDSIMAEQNSAKNELEKLSNEESKLKAERDGLGLFGAKKKEEINEKLSALVDARGQLDSQVQEMQKRLEEANVLKETTDTKWKSIAVDNGNYRVLALAKQWVAMMPYHNKETHGLEAITWEGCTLRKWLNDDYYRSLPVSIKPRVVEVMNQNPDNKGVKGGNPTCDKVFLLSISEAHKYLETPDRVAQPEAFTGSSPYWWLRSPGQLGVRAAFDGAWEFAGTWTVSGEVGERGADTDKEYGVRPAMWISF